MPGPEEGGQPATSTVSVPMRNASLEGWLAGEVGLLAGLAYLQIGCWKYQLALSSSGRSARLRGNAKRLNRYPKSFTRFTSHP
jgi:hypothetical protein